MRIGAGELRRVRERLEIRGMRCAGCALNIERRLGRLPGVERVEVSFATGEAVVEYDPSVASLRDIVEAIRGAGYDARCEEAVFEARAPPGAGLVSRLPRLPGVVDAWAAPGGRIHVVYNPASTGPAEILRALRSMGVEARLLREGGAEAGEGLRGLRLRLAASLALAAAVAVLRLAPVPGGWLAEPLLATAVVCVGGFPFFAGAYRALRGLTANMDVLVSLGAGSAYAYSLASTLGLAPGPTYYDAASMTIAIVLLGRYLEARMRSRAGEALRRLLSLQPRRARVIRGGVEAEVPAAELRVGDMVVVREGERIPVDGVVEEGSGYVDESLVTGEPMPVAKTRESRVAAGSLLATGYLVVRATRVGGDTLLSQIARLVRRAQEAKPRIQRLADRAAGLLAWAVMGVASLSLAYWRLVAGLPLGRSLVFASSVLLVTCPCALGLATPLVVAAVVGRLAEMGVVVKNGEALEKLPEVDTVVLDKTGTLTEGRPRVCSVAAAAGHSSREVLLLAAAVERRSSHPLARAIVEEAERRGLSPPEPRGFKTLPGMGAVARLGGVEVAVGNEKLMESLGVRLDKSLVEEAGRLRSQGATVVYVAAGGEALGAIALADEPRSEAAEAVRRLKSLGLRCIMVTGDDEAPARRIAGLLGIDEVYARVTPHGKAGVVEGLQRRGRRVLVVGDGVNDAPALARADVGVAMGTGADVAKEAGDVALLANNLLLLPALIEAGREAKRKIKFNILWATLYNAALVPVAAGALYSYGVVLRPELAALAMCLSSITVTLNALRLRGWRPRRA